ncbi:hypothetical protein QJS10_CPB04g01014 [Acorus calamus]|uniref:Uncharacterized protein n=1 Tax=Acorus calamus TaxID=4465 RepID=A0AAV9F4U9_ACOCL|nr:hypothetical protein QJS10_CPB04g01014 [Acorus calamus]
MFPMHQTPRHSGASVLDTDERFMDHETSFVRRRWHNFLLRGREPKEKQAQNPF